MQIFEKTEIYLAIAHESGYDDLSIKFRRKSAGRLLSVGIIRFVKRCHPSVCNVEIL